MRKQASLLAAVVVCMLVAAGTAFPCSVFIEPGKNSISDQLDRTKDMLVRADLILRVTAVEYSGSAPGQIRTSGVPDTSIRFSVQEIVKGTYDKRDILLPGYLSGSDDWNDHDSPYTFVRRNGRSGSCFANTYRQGGQFLLVLRKADPSVSTAFQGPSVDGFTVNWAALQPVNEQLRSAEDPWVIWVRQQVKPAQ